MAIIISTGNINFMMKQGNLLIILKYRKIPKFSDARKRCCNLPKIQTKMPNLMELHKKIANGIANSDDPDQTAPVGAV